MKMNQYDLNFYNVTDAHIETQQYKPDDCKLNSKSVEIITSVLQKIDKCPSHENHSTKNCSDNSHSENCSHDGPDYIFFAGDQIEARYNALANLRRFHKIISKVSTPSFVIMGNHDTRHKTTLNSYSKLDFIRTLKEHGPKYESEDSTAYWRHDVPGKNITFLGLDTSLTFTSFGEIGSRQKGWLIDNLDSIEYSDSINNPNGPRHVIILMHHPAVTFHKYAKNEGMEIYLLRNHLEIIDIFERYKKNIKLVISGHTHTSNHIKKNGIHYVSCPSIASWPNMYTRFRVEKNRFLYQLHSIEQKEWINIARSLITTNPLALKFIGSRDKIIEYYQPPHKTEWIDF